MYGRREKKEINLLTSLHALAGIATTTPKIVIEGIWSSHERKGAFTPSTKVWVPGVSCPLYKTLDDGSWLGTKAAPNSVADHQIENV